MNNPFQQDGDMRPIASINSVYVDDIKAYDLFRPTLIRQELQRRQKELGLGNISEEASLNTLFEVLLRHENVQVRTIATDIAESFGNRLAKILATLFRPSDLSRANRPEWTKQHWDYWAQIRYLYLVGGLTSPLLNQVFQTCIEQEFEIRGITMVSITFIPESQNMGTQALASILHDGDALLFDFGQTNIKRAHHKKSQGKMLMHQGYSPLEAQYLTYKKAAHEELITTARKLDDYIVDTIDKTAKEAKFQGNIVYLAIANYVSKGRIYHARGGYGKLAYLADNYQSHLNQRLSVLFDRPMKVRLYHDTSAMGLLFREQPNCAVVSLGTAFGVAFPSKS